MKHYWKKLLAALTFATCVTGINAQTDWNGGSGRTVYKLPGNAVVSGPPDDMLPAAAELTDDIRLIFWVKRELNNPGIGGVKHSLWARYVKLNSQTHMNPTLTTQDVVICDPVKDAKTIGGVEPYSADRATVHGFQVEVLENGRLAVLVTYGYRFPGVEAGSFACHWEEQEGYSESNGFLAHHVKFVYPNNLDVRIENELIVVDDDDNIEPSCIGCIGRKWLQTDGAYLVPDTYTSDGFRLFYHVKHREPESPCRFTSTDFIHQSTGVPTPSGVHLVKVEKEGALSYVPPTVAHTVSDLEPPIYPSAQQAASEPARYFSDKRDERAGYSVNTAGDPGSVYFFSEALASDPSTVSIIAIRSNGTPTIIETGIEAQPAVPSIFPPIMAAAYSDRGVTAGVLLYGYKSGSTNEARYWSISATGGMSFATASNHQNEKRGILEFDRYYLGAFEMMRHAGFTFLDAPAKSSDQGRQPVIGVGRGDGYEVFTPRTTGPSSGILGTHLNSPIGESKHTPATLLVGDKQDPSSYGTFLGTLGPLYYLNDRASVKPIYNPETGSAMVSSVMNNGSDYYVVADRLTGHTGPGGSSDFLYELPATPPNPPTPITVPAGGALTPVYLKNTRGQPLPVTNLFRVGPSSQYLMRFIGGDSSDPMSLIVYASDFSYLTELTVDTVASGAWQKLYFTPPAGISDVYLYLANHGAFNYTANQVQFERVGPTGTEASSQSQYYWDFGCDQVWNGNPWEPRGNQWMVPYYRTYPTFAHDGFTYYSAPPIRNSVIGTCYDIDTGYAQMGIDRNGYCWMKSPSLNMPAGNYRITSLLNVSIEPDGYESLYGATAPEISVTLTGNGFSSKASFLPNTNLASAMDDLMYKTFFLTVPAGKTGTRLTVTMKDPASDPNPGISEIYWMLTLDDLRIDKLQ